MNESLIPVILSCLSAITLLLFSKLVIENLSMKRMFQKRVVTLESQLRSRRNINNARNAYSNIDSQVLLFGDKLIRKEYRNRLNDLSNQVGGNSEHTFINLVRQKIYFALIGIGISFILISQGRWSLVFPAILMTFLAYFLPNSYAFFRKTFSGKYGKRLGEMATISGSAWQNTENLIRAKLISSLSVFGISYFFVLLRSESLASFGYLPIAIILGFFIPDVLLYNKVAKRREKFEETLPDSIDLLTMCVSAGLAFPAALAKVSEIQSGPVPEEFLRVRAEVQLGKDRNEALREMADRMKVDALRNFVNAVSQVDRFGIPISAALQEQSKELRAERKARGREKAQKVPIKILGPVMLCFLPCVLLIVLGPAIIGILGAF